MLLLRSKFARAWLVKMDRASDRELDREGTLGASTWLTSPWSSNYRKDEYQLRVRTTQHTTAVVGEVLYCWGGNQEGLDESHDSPTKIQCTSVIDAFNLLSGVWSSKPTRGTPPLGVIGASCTVINNNIYFFGGFCGHDSCYHNSLNCLDTLTLQWNELQPTSDNSVNKRGYGGMVAMGSEGEPQQLLIIGGMAPISTITHYHQFKYNKIPDRDDRVRTNEQNIYNLSSGQWTVPSVSGQCCPPISQFTIEKINPNKGIMYGGAVTDGGIATNDIYLFQLLHNTINWECLKQGAIPNDRMWPKERFAHASTIINGVSTSPTLVVIGGLDNRNEPMNDCLILDTNQYSWIKIPLPELVTGRYYHTVSSFVLDPNHVFLIIVGGFVKTAERKYVGGGVMKWLFTPVTDPNNTMLIELVFNDGQWSVGPVLDSFNIPLLYELILKERSKESIGMNEYMTDKVKELQDINELLRHDLQVSRINNQSLQEALLENESLSEKRMAALKTELLETKTNLKRKRDQKELPHSDNSKKLKTDELEESVDKKQIMTGDYEKLNIVADNEVYKTELLEEKTQVEEQLKEKETIIDDFKTKISEKDKQISTLMRRNSAQEERITFLEEQSMKETSSLEVQLMDNLSDVEVVEKQLFLIQGDEQLINWEKYGLRIRVQKETLLSSETVKAAVVALVGGQFQFPPNTVLVSAVYAVSLSKRLLKPLQLEIQHCIDLTGQPDLAQYLKFAIAPMSTPSLPYQFTLVEGGEFSYDSSYGSISRTEFCLVCVCGECNEGDEGKGGGTADNLPSESTSSADPILVAGPSRATETNNSLTSGQVQNKDNCEQVDNLDSDSTTVLSQLSKSTKYTGLVYYEEKGVEDLVIFTAAKKLEALLQFIEQKHSQAEIGPDISFCFKFSNDYIELNLTAQQDEPFTGWTVQPHTKPSRLYQETVNKFGDEEHCHPSRCLISVHGSPDAVPFLNYSVPLVGVVPSVTLIIHRARRNLTVPVHSTNPTTSSSSNTVTVATAVSSNGGASASATVDVNKVKKVIDDVLVSHHARLNYLKTSLSDLANQLYEVGLINDEVREACCMDKFIGEFKASFHFIDQMSEVQNHCKKFLNSFIAVRGSYINAAKFLRQKWIEAVKNELGIDFNID